MSEVITPERVGYRSAIVADQIRMLRLMGKRMTKQIIDMLNEKDMSMTEIWIKLRCEQPEASMRLRLMESYGLLMATRQGKKIVYSLNIDRLGHIQRAVNNFFQ